MRKKRQNIWIFLFSLRWLAVAPVLFYKYCISPLIPKRCAYYPSCSNYMLSSLKRHGLIKGGFYGLKRLIRCNPFTKGGFDPIPHKKRDYRWLY